MKLYPINLGIENKSCVVIGGGEVALRKIRGLLEAGALVKVIAPEICAEVEELANCGEITLVRENFSEELLGEELILIAATDNSEVNQRAAQAGLARKMLVNVVNETGGNFKVPSRIRRGELLLTVSTGGKSPAFSKFIREMLELELGENFSAGLELIYRKRRAVKRVLPNPRARKLFWQKILTQEIWELLKLGMLEVLEEKIDYALENLRLESQDDAD